MYHYCVLKKGDLSTVIIHRLNRDNKFPASNVLEGWLFEKVIRHFLCYERNKTISLYFVNVGGANSMICNTELRE